MYEPVAEIPTHLVCLSRVVIDDTPPAGASLGCTTTANDPAAPITCQRYADASYGVGLNGVDGGDEVRVFFDAPFSHAYLDPVAHVTFTTLRPAGVGDAGPPTSPRRCPPPTPTPSASPAALSAGSGTVSPSG